MWHCWDESADRASRFSEWWSSCLNSRCQSQNHIVLFELESSTVSLMDPSCLSEPSWLECFPTRLLQTRRVHYLNEHQTLHVVWLVWSKARSEWSSCLTNLDESVTPPVLWVCCVSDTVHSYWIVVYTHITTFQTCFVTHQHCFCRLKPRSVAAWWRCSLCEKRSSPHSPLSSRQQLAHLPNHPTTETSSKPPTHNRRWLWERVDGPRSVVYWSWDPKEEVFVELRFRDEPSKSLCFGAGELSRFHYLGTSHFIVLLEVHFGETFVASLNFHLFIRCILWSDFPSLLL